MSSRNLDDLHPRTRAKALAALQDCKTDLWLSKNGVDVLVTCTFRPDKEQAELYCQGRTRAQLDAVGLTYLEPRKGAIVTKALPGKSEHNHVDGFGKAAATAVDIVPLRHGKPIWGSAGDGIDDDPSDDDTDDLEAWQRIAEHFKRAGFAWYGEPGAPFRELPHFCDKG